MPNPDSQTIERMHRWFAVECNNRGWNLTTQRELDEAEEREMLQCAYAAAWHWSKVGEALQHARADMLLAHAHALVGQGESAMHHARRCLAYCEHQPCEPWDRAFAHAELALAAGTVGQPEVAEEHLERARARGEEITDEEDAKIFRMELQRIVDHLDNRRG